MHSLAAAPVVAWLLGGSAAIWIVLELRQSVTHRPEAIKAGWGSEIVFRLTVAAGALGAVGLLHAAPSATIRPAVGAAWVGLCLFWSGIALRLWSIYTLGRYFTFVVQTSTDQPVITNGPYGVIRHPSYAGILVIVVAVGLFIGNWWSLVVLDGAVTVGFVYRIRVEDRALLSSLGDDYRRYADTHQRLVPHVW